MYLSLCTYMLATQCVVTEHIHMTHHCGPLPRRFAYPHVPRWNAVQHTQQMTSALGMCV